MFSGKFAYGVCPPSFACLANNSMVRLRRHEGVAPEHLARRKANNALACGQEASGFEDVGGSNHIDTHRGHWALGYAVDTGDCSTVDNNVGPLHGAQERAGVKNVALDQGQIRVIAKGSSAKRVACQVVERDDHISINET